MGDGEKWMPDLDSAWSLTLRYDYAMQKKVWLLNSVRGKTLSIYYNNSLKTLESYLKNCPITLYYSLTPHSALFYPHNMIKISLEVK